MASSRRVRLEPLGRLDDLPGGGQIVVDGGFAYVGHLDPPAGTSILDVSDPKHPRLVARIPVPPHTHSHKVRAGDGLMLVNQEAHPFGVVQPGFVGGLRIYDVSPPQAPREITFYRTAGLGCHRFDFDGRYVYLSTEMEGFVGNITLILDLAEPASPREVSRWWLPGQWTAGGEQPTWLGRRYRTHHPLRFGDRLCVSCWEGGFAIVDVSDLTHPRTVARMDSPEGYPTHTVLPLDSARPEAGRFVIVDEGWNDANDALASGLWVADVSVPERARVLATLKLADPAPERPGYYGAHQPHEAIVDDLAFVAWFKNGLRVIDLSDPTSPREVGAFVPEPRRRQRAVQSNDVFVDRGGLVYLVDRIAGLDILQWSTA
jgi:hypothetical protein